MIIYNSRKRLGYAVMWHIAGSALPAAFTYAVIAVLLSLLVTYIQDSDLSSLHPDSSEYELKQTSIIKIRSPNVSIAPILSIIRWILHITFTIQPGLLNFCVSSIVVSFL